MVWLILGIVLAFFGGLLIIVSFTFITIDIAVFFVGLVLGAIPTFLGLMSFKKYRKHKKANKSNRTVQSITENINNSTGNIQQLHNRSSKIGCLTISLIMATFFLFIMIFTISLSINSENSEKVALNPLELIQSSLGISLEQSNSINDILLQCGVEDISNITYQQDFNDKKVYSINFKNGEIAIHVNNGILEEAYFLGHALYRNNTIESTINDYILTSEEKVDLQLLCKHTMEEILVSPSTAKYAPYNDWKYFKRKNTIGVQSYVDSQNILGTTVRSEFQFIIENGVISSLIVDGKEYIQQED